MDELITVLEAQYGRSLPRDYADALRDGRLAACEGKRPPTLPGWAPEMSYPLTFEPEIVSESFDEQSGYLPLARFLTDDGDQLHDMEDFVALDAESGVVVLCDHDGDIRSVATSVSAFIAMLR
ncbi:MAG TPA: hypothetical protein VGF94_23645 [Kofleriaceae bacterium]|jgi:hypothetical protein